MGRNLALGIRNLALGILTICHAGAGALLGLIFCALVIARIFWGVGAFEPTRDAAAVLTLVLSIPSLMATGAGISGFVLLSIASEAERYFQTLLVWRAPEL